MHFGYPSQWGLFNNLPGLNLSFSVLHLGDWLTTEEGRMGGRCVSGEGVGEGGCGEGGSGEGGREKGREGVRAQYMYACMQTRNYCL